MTAPDGENERLLALLDRVAGLRVAVVGDLILDRYVWGEATRISQEAPVPVVRVSRETATPGGAANVANNLLCLGAETHVYGLVGEDAHGRELRQCLEAAGGRTRGIVATPQRPTTVKTRVIAGHQQVVRIDQEETGEAPAAARRAVGRILSGQLRRGVYQAVIIEDYAKGLITGEFAQEIVDCAAAAGVPVALDPHPSHAFRLKGLTLMTPNRAEAFGLAGRYLTPGVLPVEKDEALLGTGRVLRKQWGIRHLLITLGGDGMALFGGRARPLHIPTRAREVFDVSGAGDTVIAAFTLALAAGARPADAAAFANCAAGIVVGKVGTVPIHAAELREYLRSPHESCRVR
ncbi:MAG: Bifunctional protein HldE [Lentisphaerae bacterium ADurb.BinA184]|nr:MAG: Bifunctional protein HldE [Lentisphaerae bacterium ADurb.BinA184]